jgi:hypothetical protein
MKSHLVSKEKNYGAIGTTGLCERMDFSVVKRDLHPYP